MDEEIRLNKDIKLNSKALIKNLEVAEQKVKGGAKLEDVLTEVDLAWHNMSFAERDKYRDKLVPRPTNEYTRKLKRLIQKYGKQVHNESTEGG